MRLDKYLKVSRIIKRRTVAKEAGEGGRVSINGKTAKPSAEVKEGDVNPLRRKAGAAPRAFRRGNRAQERGFGDV